MVTQTQLGLTRQAHPKRFRVSEMPQVKKHNGNAQQIQCAILMGPKNKSHQNQMATEMVVTIWL